MLRTNKILNSRKMLWFLVLFQFISVYLMSVGAWPHQFAWVNMAVSALFIIFSSSYASILFLIASVPFFVTFPNPIADSIPTWRILFVFLFCAWWLRASAGYYKQISANRFKRIYQAQKSLVLGVFKNLFPWDYGLIAFGFFALFTASWATYPLQTIKQVIYLLNVYVFYLVAVAVIKSRDQVIETIKYVAVSAALIVAIGYAQFTITFLVPQYYFWQYWAIMVSKIYYGLSLSKILVNSNSWFSYHGAVPELRMFSIMPDSHSFAMVAVFVIAYFLVLTYYYQGKQIIDKPVPSYIPNKINYSLWSGIRFAGFAIILSGTRGVWVGMLAPLTVALALYIKRIGRPFMRKIIWALSIIVLLFILSPIINTGFSLLRYKYRENFLNRAASIYNLGEESNANRLDIWKKSLRNAAHYPAGVGFGNFVVSLSPSLAGNVPFDSFAAAYNKQYNLPLKFITAHSLYLQLLVELGLVGLAMFGYFAFRYIWETWKFFYQHKNEENLFIFFVVTMGLFFVWFFAYGVFDVTIFNDKVLIYSLISLALSGIIMRNYKSIGNK